MSLSRPQLCRQGCAGLRYAFVGRRLRRHRLQGFSQTRRDVRLRGERVEAMKAYVDTEEDARSRSWQSHEDLPLQS